MEATRLHYLRIAEVVGWFLTTALYAIISPFLVAGLCLFVAWAAGTSAVDVRDVLAQVATGTVQEFQQLGASLRPLALVIAAAVVALRIPGNTSPLGVERPIHGEIQMTLPRDKGA